MRTRRSKVPDDIREQVIKAQGGRCALCPLTHPTIIHHIIPVHKGGKNTFHNLVLLCQNHHDLADSEIIPPEILQYYKRIAPSNTVQLEDPTFIYEVSVNKIVKDLLHRYDPELLNLSKRLFQRLQRSPSSRYRHICVELLFGIIYTSMHEVKPDIKALEKLVRKAQKMTNEMGEDGLRYQQLITHHMGMLYHKVGRYHDSKAAFETAIGTSELISLKTDDIEADKNLARVCETASDHLSGYSNRSLDHLRSIIEELPKDSESFADTYCFSQIKLAEHMIVRKEYDHALEILGNTNKSQIIGNALPLYKIILLKDLGRAYILVGDRDRGIRFLVKALGLAEHCGFKDQYSKILEIARELNIDASDLELIT